MPSTLHPDLENALASAGSSREPVQLPVGASCLSDNIREQFVVTLTAQAKYYKERLPADSEYTVTDHVVRVKGGAINIRVLKPTAGGADATYPAFVWYHGGGFVFGSIEVDDNYLRTICVELQLVVVNVGYRHAPEHVFPAAYDDCYAGLKWTVENASAFRISPSKGFIVGGDSAGGNVSAGVALKARDDPFFSKTPLTGQYLREPAMIHPTAQPVSKYASELKSLTEVTDKRLLINDESVTQLITFYAAPPTDVRMSPLLASSHVGLPPAYIQVMEVDPLRDESIVYERVLREAGVNTKIVKHTGVMHAFHYMFPASPLALEVDRYERDGLKWLLSFSQGS